MASKEWHMRVSWSLDELARDMTARFGYADRTALLKSMIRGCALVGQASNHSLLVRLSHESPAAQDQIDAELYRRWKTGEVLSEGPLKQIAEKLAAQTGADKDRIMTAAAEAIIAAARESNGLNGVNGANGSVAPDQVEAAL